MLGKMIGELNGKITGFRIECGPKMENSFIDTGKILDVDVTNMGTFWTSFKEDGGLYGEGQGILFTTEGEAISWMAHGLGKMKGKGGEWRGSVFFSTESTKLEYLNNIVGVFEYEIGEEQNTHEKLWEWI